MQRSIILPVAARYLMPLLLIFSFFLLIRGHNEIGGGFAGGLVASSALLLYAIANSPSALRRLLPIRPQVIVALGLLVSLLAASMAIFFGKPFLTGIWLPNPLPILGKVGTPVLFDVGVYLVVVGIATWILLSLAEDAELRT
jgi:multicomponent Na+:H+ antiporter subunit B